MNALRKALTAGAAMAVVALFAGASQASTTFYTTEASFLAAPGPTILEDFQDSTLASGLAITTDAGSIGGGLFNDRVVYGGAQTTFSFAGGSQVFGGFWDETPGGFGQGLALTIDLVAGGTQLLSQQINSSAGGFFGFISTDTFDSVRINAASSECCAETYNLDNMRFSAGGVPEPAAWALMLMGFGGVGVALRSNRRRFTFA